MKIAKHNVMEIGRQCPELCPLYLRQFTGEMVRSDCVWCIVTWFSKRFCVGIASRLIESLASLKGNQNFPFFSMGPVHFRFKGCWVVFFIYIQILIDQQRRLWSDAAKIWSDAAKICGVWSLHLSSAHGMSHKKGRLTSFGPRPGSTHNVRPGMDPNRRPIPERSFQVNEKKIGFPVVWLL